MALIKCIECGHEISEYAIACPNCGCPMEIIVKRAVAKNVVKKKMINQIVVLHKLLPQRKIL